MRRSWLLIPVAVVVAGAIVIRQQEINAGLQQGVMLATVAVERARAARQQTAAPSVVREAAPAALWSSEGWLAQQSVVDRDGHIVTTSREDLVIIDSAGRVIARTPLADGRDAFAGAVRRLADGRIVVPLLDGLLLLAPDGAPLRRIALAANVRPRVLAQAGDDALAVNLFASNAWGASSVLLLIDLASGRERWRFDARSHRIDWALPLGRERLLVSIAGTRWEFDASGARRAAAGNHAISGLPLVVNAAGEFVWLPAAGESEAAPVVRAHYRTGSMGCDPVHVVLAPTGVAYTSCGGKVFAVDGDGSVRWSRELDWVSPVPLQLARAGGVIAIVDHGIVSLDAAGATRWQAELWRRLESEGVEPRTVPVQPSGALLQGADGTLYVGTQDNGVYAIAPDGRLLWNYGTHQSNGDSGYVTQLAFLDGALLVNAARLIALPVGGARLAPIAGVPFHDSRD